MYVLHLLAWLLLVCAVQRPALAQTTYRISGTVTSATTGEALVGATVAVPGLQAGSITNQVGAYSVNLPAGDHTLQVTYIGFEPLARTITVSSNAQRQNLSLQPASNQLQEVEVETNSLTQKLNDNRMSVERLSSREAKLLPALFGEVDLIKTLQLKPGVQSGGEGASGLYVRGGSSDQNLVLLDDAVIYNPSHLFGFFSVFNPDAVEDVELYKAGFPAEFGGRLSSVVDVKLREGNKDSLVVSGGLGLISSRLTVEGPLVKDKSSFILSGRRTYVDVFTRQFNRISEDKEDYSPIPDYYFYDFNAKLNYKLSDKDNLYFSGYYGRDFFSFSDDDFAFGFEWGNTMASLRWQHKFSDRLYANTMLSTTGYKYTVDNKLDVFNVSLTSDILDYTLESNFDLFLDGGHTVRFGAKAIQHSFTVGRLNFNSAENPDQDFSAGSDYEGTEFGVYASDDFEVSPFLSLNYGLRFSGFVNNGKLFTALEPRASAKYNLSETVSIKASYANMMQYVHLVANSGASLPTDVWYPSTGYVKPQRSQQVAAGISKLFADGKFLVTNEVYYKWMRRQIDFRDGANLFVNDNIEQEFLFGKGESYGNEIYFEKIKGRTTGWLGYTLSWTYRTFEGINNGNRFPTRYDRRHDINLVVLHQLNKRISLTGAFVYGTGNAFSLPVARFPFQDVEGKSPTIVPIFTERNGFRLASYHRLDLGLVLKLKPKRGEADLTFSAYNAYNRRNPYFVYFEQAKEDPQNEERITGFQAKQVSLFPVIPSVTYNFKF
ncbi:TonB-dependent receptor [Pontibacter arcticus]|uniref:TonB-dependent receptor n=1 Tax=Pontibacter arcticus TaxID=2080288 RepID=A0A364RER8_9BACT|nr:TonB-dependent receptor [Pontibacter arcticus]